MLKNVIDVKERILAWKRLYTQNCQKCDENSSWYNILIELGYYRHDNFLPFSKTNKLPGNQKLGEAFDTIGFFSAEECKFLDSLPAYHYVISSLKFDDYREYYHTKFDEDDMKLYCKCCDDKMELFCMCRDNKVDVPIREYIIVTSREDLWGLEIYFVSYNGHFPNLCRHIIISYSKEPPADYIEPKYDDNLPF